MPKISDARFLILATDGFEQVELTVPRDELRKKGARVKVATPLYTALLGGEVMVPTPRGARLALKVPPETQNNKVIRLRGQGMPVLGRADERGDLLVQLQVVLPVHLSSEERTLFQRLAELRGRASTPEGVRA